MSKVSYLILDYQKPNESKICLDSIRKNSKFDYQIIYLSNGGEQDYVWQYYKLGLIDKCIFNLKNNGLGYGTEDLIHICDTEYFIYFQNDQELIYELNQNDINQMKDFFVRNKMLGALGWAGTPCGFNTYSERAHMMKTEFYNSIPKTHGGCGPYNHLKYNEQCVQEYFKDNKYTFVSLNPLVKDIGWYTVRDMEECGTWCMRTDNKKLWNIKKPVKINPVFPKFTEEEKIIVLSESGWPDGKIPELEMANSFHCWDRTDEQDIEYVTNLRNFK